MPTETWQVVGTDIKVVGVDTFRAQMKSLQDAATAAGQSLRALKYTAANIKFPQMPKVAGGGTAGLPGAGAAAARGIQQTTASVGGLRGALSSLTSPLGLVMTGLGVLGAGLGVGKINEVSNEFEQMRIKMAQTIIFMGQADNFPAAMGQAEAMINRINIAAAALPGEASDYAAAMASAGAAAMRATGDAEKSFELIRDTSAVLISMGADGSYAGAMITRALNPTRGQLEMGSDLAMNMVRAMQKIPGYANITTAAFNNMNLEKRTQLVTQMTSQFDGMIAAQEGTWEATKGAFDSAFAMVTRIAGVPVFEGMKSAMKFVTDSLVTDDGQLTEFAKSIQISVEMIGVAVGDVTSFIASGLAPLADVFAALSGADVGGAAGGVAGAIAEIFQSIVDVGTPVIDFLATLFNVGSGIVMSVLPGLIQGLMLVIDPLLTFAELVFDAGSWLLQYLQEPLMWIGTAIGDLVVAMGEVLGPTIDLISGVLGMFGSILGETLMPVLKGLGFVIGLVIEGLAKLLSVLGAGIRTLAGEGPRGRGEQERQMNEQGWFQRTFGAIRDRLAQRASNSGAAGAPSLGGATDRNAGRGNGTTVNQDFRNSKFNITNKFAEGFDPDRIAVAFSQDIGRAATRRGSSGLAPLYGVR